MPCVGLGVAEALREGEEVLVEHVLAGGGKGGEGAAVKGVAQGQDGAAWPVLVVVYLRASLMRPSLDSAPELAKKAAAMPDRAQHSRPARRPAGRL